MSGGSTDAQASQPGPTASDAAGHALHAAPPGQTHHRTHYLQWSRAGSPSLPRYVAGLLLICLAWAVGTLTVQLPLLALGEPPSQPALELALITATFLGGFLAVPLAVRWLLRRQGWTVAAGWLPGPFRGFALGAAITVVVGLVVDVLTSPWAPLERAAFEPFTWLSLAVVAVIGFVPQTGLEELVFRGWLMQAVASRTSRAVLVIGLPAVLFALLHWGNLAPYDGEPLQVVPYLLTALTLGWAAWYSGSLWLPFGMHWANNLYATLVVHPIGDVLPAGAPLARDLGGLPLTVLIATTALQCAIQILLVRRLLPQGWHLRDACAALPQTEEGPPSRGAPTPRRE